MSHDLMKFGVAARSLSARLARRLVFIAAVAVGVFLVSTHVGGLPAPGTSGAPVHVISGANDLASLRRRETLSAGFETGSQELSELLYSVGARLAVLGWEPEIIPYSCAVRVVPSPGESVWYRVSGENLLARRPGPVNVLIVAAADEIAPPLPRSRETVGPEEMVLYVAEACSEETLEGVALALVSSKLQGGAGLQSLLKRADLERCRVVVLEGSSTREDRLDAFIRGLLPPAPTVGYLWRYPDHDHEVARRYASALARRLGQNLTVLSAVESGASFVTLGSRVWVFETRSVRWAALGLAGLCVLALVLSARGRSSLGDLRGFLHFGSFLGLSFPPLLLPAIYVRSRYGGGPIHPVTGIKLIVTVVLLVLFSWLLAALRFFEEDSRRDGRAGNETGCSSAPPDFRPFACLFLGGLAAGAAISLPPGDLRASALPQYTLAMSGFLISFFVGPRAKRVPKMYAAAMVCLASVPAVLTSGTISGGSRLRDYVESLAGPDRTAFVPFLVASIVAAEVASTARAVQGKHGRRTPRRVTVLIGAGVLLLLSIAVWAIPGPKYCEEVLVERVLSAQRPYETPLSGYLSDSETELPQGPVLKPADRWADLDLSYKVVESKEGLVHLRVTLAASFREAPTFIKVTFQDISLPSARSRRPCPPYVEGSDFLGISQPVPDEIANVTSFVRWRPYDPALVSSFSLYTGAQSRIRVQVQAVYAGKTYSLPLSTDTLASFESPWAAVFSSWEDSLDIP